MVALAQQLRRRVTPLAVAAWLIVALAGQPFLEVTGLDDQLGGLYWPLVVMLGGLAVVSSLVPSTGCCSSGAGRSHSRT